MNRAYEAICCLQFVALINSFCSCNRRDYIVIEDAMETYSIGKGEERVRISDISNEATIFPLDSTSYIAGIDKFFVKGDHLYVLNNQNLYCFNINSGVQKVHYNEQGRSAEEYLKIMDFDVDSETGRVYLLCLPNKIIELSPSLAFSRVIDIKEDYNRIAVRNDSFYLYSYYRHRLDLLNGSRIIPVKEFPETPAWVFGESPVFHKSAEGLLFTPEPFSSVYSINGKDIKHIIHFAYPNEEKVKERLTNKRLLDQELLKYAFPKMGNIMLMDSFMVATYTYGIRARVCVIDRNKHEIVKDGLLNAANPFPVICYDHSLIAAEFYNPDSRNYFLDTLSMKFIYDRQPAKENEQLALFKYVFSFNRK